MACLNGGLIFDRKDRIWVAYNDQGYAQPISERGLSCFDSQGQLLSPWWDAFDPFDCYAMNVAKDAIWLYYYTPFPVARLDYDGRLQEWHHGVRGAQAILARGNRVALFGGYEPGSSQLSLLELMPNQTALLRHQETVLLAEGCPAGQVQGRGGHFHTLEDSVWYRLSPAQPRREDERQRLSLAAMPVRVHLLVFLLVSALCGVGISAWGRPSGSGLSGLRLVETQLSDGLFLWRGRLCPASIQLDPRILLVGLDDEALQELDKPDVFWDEDLAGVTQSLLKAGVQAVGIDFVRNPPMGHAPKVFQEMLESWQNDMLDCLLSDRVVVIELLAGNAVRAWPERLVQNAAGGRNSCVANLRTDPDGVIRSVPFLFKTGQGQNTVSTFSARLAELTAGADMQQGASGWSFVNRPVILGGDSLRLNYPGPAGTLPKVSLATLLRKFRNHQSFAEYQGKLVLILPEFATDLHATPTMLQDDRQTLGAEIHAAAINTFLTGRYLQTAPAWAWWAAGGLVSGLVCLVFARLRVIFAALLSGLLFLVYYPGCLWLFSYRGWIMPLLGPALGGVFSAGLGLFARYWTSDQARLRAQRLLSRMVSPQVASMVLRGSDLPQMGGRRQPLTVLFSDINLFTPTCEKYQPEQVIEMLNTYFAEMVAIIHAHGGYVKQFVGDEIMAIFGAPEPCQDHPRQAVECALAMLERLDYLRSSHPDKPGFYSVKIGINTGQAVVGQVGSLERSEYAAVGDDVNLAARLESLTTSMGVSNLISPSTKACCEEAFKGWSWKSLGTQKFKGKSVEMEVWTLQQSGRGHIEE